MKKITKLMLTLALLVIGVDGVKAAETKIHEYDYEGKTVFFWGSKDAESARSFDNGTLKIVNDAELPNNWDIQQIIADDISTIYGNSYKVRITLKCSADGKLVCNFGSWAANSGKEFSVSATDDYVTKEIEFTNFPSTTGAHVLYQGGKYVGTVNIKKIEVFVISPDAPTKTIRHYLRLSDSNLITDFWQPHTVNPADGTVLNESQNNNSAIAWYFDPVFDASDYTSLVVKLKSGAPAELKIRLYDSGGFWDGDNVRTSTTIAPGGTYALIDLASIKKGDDTNLILNSIKYVDILNTSFTTTTYTIDEIYFEKEVGRDFTTEPFDINNLTVSEGITFDAETQTISFSENGWSKNVSWFYSPAQDWSGYHYFVMVPQKKWSELGFGENNYRINIDSYYMNENVETKVDIDCWYQTWSQRANIVDIETKLPYPKYSVTRLAMFCPDQPISFQFAAFYLTNTRPASDGDYVRAIETADTWGTLCLPYHFALCGAVAYDVVGVDSKDSPSKLYLEPKYGVLEAGKAYLFKTNSTDGLRAYRAGEEEVASPGTGYLHGTFVGATVPNDGYSYILKDGVWKKSISGKTNTVAANRAYLTITDNLVVPVSAAKEKGWLTWDMENGDLTTGINNISDNTDKEVQTGIYDIQGRRMDNSTKLHRGLYIINGKKVFVK